MAVDGGLFEKAKSGTQEWEKAQENEQEIYDKFEGLLNEYTNTTKDPSDDPTKDPTEEQIGELVLSSTSGTLTYPSSLSFTVDKNTSGGTLSVSSSNESIVKASISGTTVTLTPQAVTTDGKKATITVTSSANGNYEEQTATYIATVNRGSITITATAYTGIYDGTAHNAVSNVTTNPTGTTITYALNGGSYSSSIPTVTGAGTYTVSIKAEKAGYVTKEVTKTITVKVPEVSINTVKVGDYIAYKPDLSPNYMGLSEEYVGTNQNPTGGIPQDTTLKWRVMNINSDGSVEIVSTSPISTEVEFSGAEGCNNGVLLLNDLCKTQYSNSELSATARSINLVDIEKKFNSTAVNARKNLDYGYSSFGGSIQYHPKYDQTTTMSNIYVPFIYCIVPITSLPITSLPTTTTPVPAIGIGNLTVSESSTDAFTKPIKKRYEKRNTFVARQTYYNLSILNSYFDDSNFYEVIFDTNSSYWLASRYTQCFNGSRTIFRFTYY